MRRIARRFHRIGRALSRFEALRSRGRGARLIRRIGARIAAPLPAGSRQETDMTATAFRTISTFAAALFMSGMLISAAISLPPLA